MNISESTIQRVKRSCKNLAISLILLFFLISFLGIANGSRVLRVGLYENEPKIFTQNGKAVGFWPDIIQYIASKEGWKIEWVPGTWRECQERLEAGEIDIMPDVGYTEERSRKYAFQNETVFISWSRVYVPTGSKIQSLPDLKGKKIAVLKKSVNYVGKDGIKELTEKFGIECVFVELDNYISVFEVVEAEKVGAGVVNKEFGNRHERNYQVERTGIVFQPSDLKFAFPKDAPLTPHLIERIDYHIIELKEDKDSIYYQSMERYFEMAIPREPVAPGWTKWVLIGIVAVVALLAGGNFILSRRVESRTKELRESEEKYRRLAENVADVLLQIDLDGNFTYMSKNLEEITGYTRDEVEGMNIKNFLSTKSYERAVERIKKWKEGAERLPPYEVEVMTKDGGKVPFELNTSPVFEDGNLTTIQIVARNITERKKAEYELKKSEENYRQLVEALNEGIWRIDAEGYTTFVNPKMAEMLGYTVKEMEGKHLFAFIDDEWVEKAKKNLKKRRQGVAEQHEFMFRKKDGEPAYMLVNTSPVFDDGGRYVGALAGITDITERQKAEEQREEAREEAEFYADVLAHDMGNLNQIMLGYLYLLREAEERETIEKNIECVKKTIMEAKRLAENIQMLKRIKETSVERTSLGDALERSIERLYKYFDREIEINITLDEHYVNANVFLDEALFSVLENAVEYTFHEPVTIDIFIEERDGICDVHIRDYGIGISEQKRKDILENLETLSKRTGMGLYLTKRIIESYGGSLDIEKKETGTEVVLSIPEADTEDSEKDAPPQRADKHRRQGGDE